MVIMNIERGLLVVSLKLSGVRGTGVRGVITWECCLIEGCFWIGGGFEGR